MLAKGKAPKVRIAVERRVPIRDIPEGRQSKDCVSRLVRAKGEQIGRICTGQEKDTAGSAHLRMSAIFSPWVGKRFSKSLEEKGAKINSQGRVVKDGAPGEI